MYSSCTSLMPECVLMKIFVFTNGKLKTDCGLLHNVSVEEDSVFLIKSSIQKF